MCRTTRSCGGWSGRSEARCSLRAPRPVTRLWRWLLGIAAALAVLMGIAAVWLRFHPRTPMLEVAGLEGERASGGGRDCQRWLRPTRFGMVPTGRGRCARVERRTFPRREQAVEYDLWTREVTHVRHLWEPRDSLGWEQAQDSVATAMEQRGGRRLDCNPFAIGKLPHLRAQRAWRFPAFDIRLTAHRWSPPKPWEWMLQVDAFPDGARGCEVAAPADLRRGS